MHDHLHTNKPGKSQVPTRLKFMAARFWPRSGPSGWRDAVLIKPASGPPERTGMRKSGHALLWLSGRKIDPNPATFCLATRDHQSPIITPQELGTYFARPNYALAY